MTNPTIESILNRRSVRAYEKTPVDRADLELLTLCGQYAATAMGVQPWHFTVVADRKLLDEISEANRRLMLQSTDERVRQMADQPGYDNFRGAPAAIIVSGDGTAFAVTDCANATQNMAVAAYSMGLSSCYIASFRHVFEKTGAPELKEKLGIPAGYEPLFALALGFGSEDLKERAPRKENAVNFVE